MTKAYGQQHGQQNQTLLLLLAFMGRTEQLRKQLAVAVLIALRPFVTTWFGVFRERRYVLITLEPGTLQNRSHPQPVTVYFGKGKLISKEREIFPFFNKSFQVSCDVINNRANSRLYST